MEVGLKQPENEGVNLLVKNKVDFIIYIKCYPMSCQAKDMHSNPCRNKGPFCKFHLYMKEYTPEMIEGCKLCKGCKKMKYMEMESCNECMILGAEKRKKAKANIILCVKDGCKFKKSENKYCGKHQMYKFMDETAELGLKTCFNVIRGCRSQMAIDDNSRCKECLGKEREKDHKKRHVEHVKTETEQQCSTCCKMYPLDAFKGPRGENKTCSVCREANKRADEKRDMERVRELSCKNSVKPERKEVKARWRDKNADKELSYCLNARAKKINEDTEKYLKDKAEQAKKWRLENPEKVKLINEKKINSMDSQYEVYKRCANEKQLDFEITIDEYKSIVQLPCHYCGIVQEKGFNGMDRLDSSKGYVVDNVVSCCEMCNYMKKCLSPNVFIKIAEHIYSYSKKTGPLYPEMFQNTKVVRYSSSKISAISRNITFDVTKECFDKIKQECCYLCGKKNSETHQNGIDRVDSSIGYIESNIQSCCGTCNIMKSNYSLDSFLKKCSLIAMHHKPVEETNQLIAIVKGNKLSIEEKTERERIKKQKQRDTIKEKYGDEEYKKMNAKKMAEQRKKKKELK